MLRQNLLLLIKKKQKEYLKNKDADISANYNFSKKMLSKDLNPIRKKIGSGVNLSDEDMSEYKKVHVKASGNS